MNPNTVSDIHSQPEFNWQARRAEIIEDPRAFIEAAKKYVSARTVSPHTVATYCSRWRQFVTYCRRINASPLPATRKIVDRYVEYEFSRRLRISSVHTSLSAIRFLHHHLRDPDPTIAAFDRLFERVLHTPTISASSRDDLGSSAVLEAALAAAPVNFLESRDRAVVAVAYCHRLSGPELTRLQYDDYLPWSPKHAAALFVYSRDPMQEPTIRRVTPLAERCLDEWIRQRGNAPGPLFPSVCAHHGGAYEPLRESSIPMLIRAWARRRFPACRKLSLRALHLLRALSPDVTSMSANEHIDTFELRGLRKLTRMQLLYHTRFDHSVEFTSQCNDSAHEVFNECE